MVSQEGNYNVRLLRPYLFRFICFYKYWFWANNFLIRRSGLPLFDCFLYLTQPCSLQFLMQRLAVDLLTLYFSRSCSLLNSPFLMSAQNIDRSVQSSTLQDLTSPVYPFVTLFLYSLGSQDNSLQSSYLRSFACLSLLLSLSSISWSMTASQSSSEYSGDSQPSMNSLYVVIAIQNSRCICVLVTIVYQQANKNVLFARTNISIFSYTTINPKLFPQYNIYLLHLIVITLMLSKILNRITIFRSCNLPTMENKPQLAVYYVTASSTQEAETIASALVQSKLAACANIIDGIKSVYVWEGKVNKDNEVLMIIKSRLSLLKQIEQKVKSLHSYQVPQVIAMPIAGGSEDYTNWVISNTIQN